MKYSVLLFWLIFFVIFTFINQLQLEYLFVNICRRKRKCNWANSFGFLPFRMKKNKVFDHLIKNPRSRDILFWKQEIKVFWNGYASVNLKIKVILSFPLHFTI